MRAIVVGPGFGVEQLHEAERVVPEPGPGEVLLAMRAAALNRRDLMMVRGEYNPKQTLPLVPCSDGVGEIVAVGPDVRRVAVGDRVCPIFAPNWLDGSPTAAQVRDALGGPRDGVLQEQLVVHEDALVKVPAHLSDCEAATLPCAALTAWSALVTLGDSESDRGREQWVLTQGTGGVSLFALQFAKLLGYRVVATSSSEAKLARLRELGADATINYRETPQWGCEVKRLTGGGACNVIEVGGAGTLSESLAAVAFAGQVSIIGVLDGAALTLDLRSVLMRQIRLQGVLVGSRAGFEAMNAAIAQHQLRPVIDDHRFALDQAPAAFKHLASNAHFGKVVIEVGSA